MTRIRLEPASPEAAGASGRIALFALGYDVHGHNPFNPSTVIGWVRRA